MHAQTSNPMLEAALDYARRGWPVFPLHSMRTERDGREWCTCGDGRCSSKAKHPLVRQGLKDATTEERPIHEWWRKWPHANVGVRTGGNFFVVDIDPRHHGDETLAELERVHGELPATVRATTGGGGAHIFFRGKAQSRSNVAQGIDVRGEGGYIVAAPSLHESGKRYDWELAYHPDDVAIAEPPPWLNALVAARREPKPSGEAGPDKVIEGGRNNWLTSVGGKLRHDGLSSLAIEAALLVVNRERCFPPIDDLDVRRIAASVGRYEAGRLPDNPTGEIQTLWAKDMANEPPPIRWVSEGLTIGGGRPTVIAGKGGSRKGWFLVALMVCGAANVKLLSRFSFKQHMRSIYLDYEAGDREIHTRARQLAVGYGVDLRQLGEAFGYRWRPVSSFAPRNDKDREITVSTLCRHVEGFDVAIVDSLYRSTGGVEENSALASMPLEIANDVYQRTRCTFVFSDHIGKDPPADAATKRDRGDLQRGHSSKKDGTQTLLIFSAGKGKPTRVTCERSQIAPEAEWPKDFVFTLAGQSGGLILQEMGEPEDNHDVSLNEAKSKIRKFFHEHAGVFRGSREELRAVGRIARPMFTEAFASLRAEGWIEESGSYHNKEFRWLPEKHESR